MIESYPESAPARYWYLVNLGSWAEVYGIFSAAKEGVADLMRGHSNKIIQHLSTARKALNKAVFGHEIAKSQIIQIIAQQ